MLENLKNINIKMSTFCSKFKQNTSFIMEKSDSVKTKNKLKINQPWHRRMDESRQKTAD
jgi:hypothetical protein